MAKISKPSPNYPQILGCVILLTPKNVLDRCDADMTTKGFEVTVGWQDKFNVDGKPLKYQVRASLFDYVSTIDKYYNPDKRFTDYYDGMVIGELWGFRTDGLFQEDPSPESYINTIFRS